MVLKSFCNYEQKALSIGNMFKDFALKALFLKHSHEEATMAALIEKEALSYKLQVASKVTIV